MERQRSTESHGLGQSGYTAGRHEHDRALERELEPENPTYRRDIDDEHLKDELGTDDRFTGRGGRRPAPASS